MADAATLIRMERPWPWGLVILTDVKSRELLPETMDTSIAVGVGTAVVCRILHAVDGVAVAEVTRDSEPPGLPMVYDAPITFPSGELRLGDAANEETEQATVDPGPWRVRVFVDDVQHPERVVMALAGSQ